MMPCQHREVSLSVIQHLGACRGCEKEPMLLELAAHVTFWFERMVALLSEYAMPGGLCRIRSATGEGGDLGHN